MTFMQTLLAGREKLDLAPGKYSLRCTLSGDGKELCRESLEFTVFPKAAIRTPRRALDLPRAGAHAVRAGLVDRLEDLRELVLPRLRDDNYLGRRS